MSTERWQWVPMLVPFDALPRIASELSGAPLGAPEADNVTSFTPTTNPGLVRTVVRCWRGSGVRLELTQQVHQFSERGERPSEESTWAAQIIWEAERTTLFLDGSAWGGRGSSTAPATCAYRFKGDQTVCDAIERRWLEILEREFFEPVWPTHPLVPESFRAPLNGIGLATESHRATSSDLGKKAHGPALFCTSGAPAWGMIVSRDRALPLGPLPKHHDTFVLDLERPSGAPRREAREVFEALIRDAPRLEQVVAESRDASGAVGCVSLSKMPDRTRYAMWRGAGWIVRSQLGFKATPARPSRHGAFEFEWAIQSERGSFALFARQTQSHSSEHERLTLCVVARWPRFTYLRHLRPFFAAEGWTWLKLQPSSLWW